MNLSFKDLRFIIEAIEHQIDAYKERLQVIEDIDEDEAADLGNDIKFLELLHTDLMTSLARDTSVKPVIYNANNSPDEQDNLSGNSKDLSFQELVKLTMNLSLIERLFLVEAITASVRQEVSIAQ
ncbi:MAG: hypothetical protein HC786_24280 [Richelia sp. CSU_2_1]|nr:hypothetical protein [Richelia sp. CSU_2_1]